MPAKQKVGITIPLKPTHYISLQITFCRNQRITNVGRKIENRQKQLYAQKMLNFSLIENI